MTKIIKNMLTFLTEVKVLDGYGTVCSINFSRSELSSTSRKPTGFRAGIRKQSCAIRYLLDKIENSDYS